MSWEMARSFGEGTVAGVARAACRRFEDDVEHRLGNDDVYRAKLRTDRRTEAATDPASYYAIGDMAQLVLDAARVKALAAGPRS